MGLFGRKKKEWDDPVGVKCSCNNGVETVTTYETIRNPEPRPRFYPWMNNPGSEEYAQGGDRDARAFTNYESSKTVASGSYTKPCSRCNGTGIRIVEWKEADKKDLTIVYPHPIFNEHGVMDLSKQRRDSDPIQKPPEQKPEIQVKPVQNQEPVQAPVLIPNALPFTIVTLYKRIEELEANAYETIQEMSKLNIPIQIKLSFDKCLNELKKTDLIEKFIPSEQKELIGSINNSAADFFSEYGRNKILGKESSSELFSSLYSSLHEILEIRAKKLGVTLKSQKVNGVDTYYLDYWSAPFVNSTVSTTPNSPNKVRIEQFKSKLRVLVRMISQISSKEDEVLKSEINRKSLALTKEINSLIPLYTPIEKIEVEMISDRILYEIKHAARRLGVEVKSHKASDL
ncbi:MAG: hypothetical protein KGH65_04825 [Candidatus Micrarchaeota archaeon]|nr:hypothetical protein [Candidatus Micrarchaeota archaeon]